MKANEILLKYSNGELSLEDANKELKAIGAGYYLDPDKNNLTEDEIKNGTAGLLDTGTGSLDKVQVKDGELVNADLGDMSALCIICGKAYKVKGKKLIEA